jgi:hypothetical protein
VPRQGREAGQTLRPVARPAPPRCGGFGVKRKAAIGSVRATESASPMPVPKPHAPLRSRGDHHLRRDASRSDRKGLQRRDNEPRDKGWQYCSEDQRPEQQRHRVIHAVQRGRERNPRYAAPECQQPTTSQRARLLVSSGRRTASVNVAASGATNRAMGWESPPTVRRLLQQRSATARATGRRCCRLHAWKRITQGRSR